MRLTVTRIIIIGILLLWIIAAPFTAIHQILQFPNMYNRWLQDGRVYERLTQTITILIFREIPEEQWSPWINRHPDVIQNLINLAVDKPTFDRIAPPYLVCWVQWWMGDRHQPCLLVREVTDAIDTWQWETLRANLWESLPSCAERLPPGCKPVDAADYSSAGHLQSDWWEVYRTELVEAALRMEEQAVSTLPGTHLRIRASSWALLFCFTVTLATYFYVEPEKRLTYLSLLFLCMGASTWVVGQCLAFGLVRYSMLRHIAGINTVQLLELLLPQIWPMGAYLMGKTLIFLGCVTIIPGVVGLSAVVSQPTLRVLFLFSAIPIIMFAYAVFPETAFIPALPSPLATPQPMPTAWPTFTASPTISPTPTRRPLPVIAGTALPPITDVWWHKPEVLRCTSTGSEPYEVVVKQNDELWMVQDDTHYRMKFTTFDRIAEQNIPYHYNQIILSPSGNVAALTADRDVWLYTLPEWQPVFRSRITLLDSVQVLLFSQDESFVIFGLGNGNVWVSDRRTGELRALFAAHQAPVTALADYRASGLFYSGAADGTVSLLDIQSGKPISQYSGHISAVQGIFPVNDDTQLITFDASGRFIKWDALKGVILRERAVASLPSSNIASIQTNATLPGEISGKSDGFLVAGTQDGQLFFIDQDLDYHSFIKFDNPVTIIYPVLEDYLVVGMMDGKLCIVGTP